MKRTRTYVGIDIGKRICVACTMGADGVVLMRSKYPNTRKDVNAFIDGLAAYDCMAACESTARMWIKTYEEFERRGIPITLANPLRLKMAQSGVKTDRIDAQKLANKLRLDDIPACYVLGPEARRVMDILRQRILLVQERTRYLNRQHSILDKYDYTIKAGSSTSGEKHQSYLDSLKLGPGDMVLMAQYVRAVRRINEEVSLLERMISKAAYQSEYARTIMSLPGFDAFGALLVAVSIDDIGRFTNTKSLVSFMGLCPRVYQSGDSNRHGRMKKDTDRTLNWVMMHAALVAKQHDPYLKAFYESHAKRHHPIIARSHLANKMATYIWHMLTKDIPYRHVNTKSYETKLARLKASL